MNEEIIYKPFGFLGFAHKLTIVQSLPEIVNPKLKNALLRIFFIWVDIKNK